MKPLHWTAHAKMKMRQYGISEARVRRVLRSPARIETGIASKTIAVMQPATPRHSERSVRVVKNFVQKRTESFDSGLRPSLRMSKKGSGHEIWVMYKDTASARKVIAAWRYPGASPVRQAPPFPVDIL